MTDSLSGTVQNCIIQKTIYSSEQKNGPCLIARGIQVKMKKE